MHSRESKAGDPDGDLNPRVDVSDMAEQAGEKAEFPRGGKFQRHSTTRHILEPPPSISSLSVPRRGGSEGGAGGSVWALLSLGS